MGRGRKKKPEKEPNLERWLVSYADFITLLFAVFVTLYAMSQTDKRKVEALVASLRESFGYVKTGASAERVTVMDSTDLRSIPSIKPEILTPGKGGEDEGITRKRTHAEIKDFEEIKKAIEEYLNRYGAQDKVNVEVTKRGLVVSLKEVGFFDSGSAVVKESAYPLLAKVAESLTRYTNPVRVEGNTDNVPISSRAFKSNWELSTTRATNIVHYLIENYGFQPEKISAVGYGEYRPMADNESSSGRSKNRRVDIVLLAKENEGAEP
ncbi:MAG TPA: flagellar motor protein MotB [Geobacteraceae bacterium]|nr:flagellar motor protein MotB [Geobacteraceae bacterium]